MDPQFQILYSNSSARPQVLSQSSAIPVSKLTRVFVVNAFNSLSAGVIGSKPQLPTQLPAAKKFSIAS